ncbi:MAG: citramalate synthase [Oscillospiraceae bacterium]|jgi:2-isopropylmalate synthase|nr:citramalate synthase [Oscillospiraceae bacterium]
MKVEVFDSTLRDGAQGEGIQFSVVDMLEIVKALDNLGVDYIEAGNPASCQKNRAFFDAAKGLPLRHSKLAVFGATDKNLCRLPESGAQCACVVGKAWSLHARKVLRVSPEENLAMIESSARSLKGAGMEVFFDAEHFFDACKEDREYAMSALDAAARGGASRLVLCDTNGGTLPDEVFDITSLVARRFPLVIGIHCHNDCGCAAANTVMAVKAGARHVQGTFTGFGERCGNAALSSVIPLLQLKLGHECIPPANLPLLTATAHFIAETANTPPDPLAPFVGVSAFAHKAGMHIDGMTKLARAFEHIEPDTVGNERRFLVSEASGRGALLPELRKYAPGITKDSPIARDLTEALKKLEFEGYQFEAAQAGLELFVRRRLGQARRYFELLHYRVINEQDDISFAMVKLRVDGAEEITASEGCGPVHALDKALRKALYIFYPCLKKVRLIDYKVRVLQSAAATASGVRVLIQSSDGADIWSTVGVSANIISASCTALTDSIEYYLHKSNAEARQWE